MATPTQTFPDAPFALTLDHLGTPVDTGQYANHEK